MFAWWLVGKHSGSGVWPIFFILKSFFSKMMHSRPPSQVICHSSAYRPALVWRFVQRPIYLAESVVWLWGKINFASFKDETIEQQLMQLQACNKLQAVSLSVDGTSQATVSTTFRSVWPGFRLGRCWKMVLFQPGIVWPTERLWQPGQSELSDWRRGETQDLKWAYLVSRPEELLHKLAL